MNLREYLALSQIEQFFLLREVIFANVQCISGKKADFQLSTQDILTVLKLTKKGSLTFKTDIIIMHNLS